MDWKGSRLLKTKVFYWNLWFHGEPFIICRNFQFHKRFFMVGKSCFRLLNVLYTKNIYIFLTVHKKVLWGTKNGCSTMASLWKPLFGTFIFKSAWLIKVILGTQNGFWEWQWSPILFLEIYFPTNFNSNPDQTQLNQLRSSALDNYRQMCLIRVGTERLDWAPMFYGIAKKWPF